MPSTASGLRRSRTGDTAVGRLLVQTFFSDGEPSPMINKGS